MKTHEPSLLRELVGDLERELSGTCWKEIFKSL